MLLVVMSVVQRFLNETFLLPGFNKQYGWTEATVVNEGMLTQNTKLFYSP